MSKDQPVELLVPDAGAAERLGTVLGKMLVPGTTVLLQGPVGAGKSLIARAAIRALCGAETDVPSPSFTLVQTYPGPGCDIWHADLYRLTSTREVDELGLIDAMETEIVLVEWPDRLGAACPVNALRLDIRPDGDRRRIVLSGPDALIHRMTSAGAA